METTRGLIAADRSEHLLPGILDAITLNYICTKLPWRAVYVLSLVSPAWQRATRNRQVFEARVRSQSTETLVVLGRIVSTKSFGLDLYSLQDKACYQLPWLSQLEGRRSWYCNCVSLDGKIYAVGRLTDENKKGEEVCVLDVAGHQGWKNCADMQAQRRRFGCGVMDGKIYGVGGHDDDDHESGSEVYDPNTNVWSSISPMKSLRADFSVATLGEELYVYGGYHRTRGARSYYDDVDENDELPPLEIYHPTKNEWRQVESWSTSPSEHLFMSCGKIYGVRWDGIYVHDDDIEKNSWILLHLFEDGFRLPRERQFVAVGDEVLDLSLYPGHPKDGRDLCLRQSKGFTSTTKELVWETIKVPR